MTSERHRQLPLPESVRQSLDDLRGFLGVELGLWRTKGGRRADRLYPPDDEPAFDASPSAAVPVRPRDGSELELEVTCPEAVDPARAAAFVRSMLERTLDFSQEIRFFTFELSERYEEINLLYSISETLGRILRLDEAMKGILGEVCDVMGARRGSLWVHDTDADVLDLVASVGEGGLRGPIRVDDAVALTAQTFREGRPSIASADALKAGVMPGVDLSASDTVLSVPIRYSPPMGEARTVGVINLLGRRRGGRFTASDQKLLAAIASQVGAAIENNRLIQESLARERMAREMELAHHLQMKLLPAVDDVEGARVAARVEPADLVGGDFYQVFRLPGDLIGVMIGDVSSHGFPAALIMALSMSAATIYASESRSPARVLRRLDDALRDELETTEMYLSLFYAVIDCRAGELTYANAGHPHAFVVTGEGTAHRLDATDPPVGIAGPDSYGERSRPWRGDDLLLLFTDGLADALRDEGGRDGEARVVDTVVRHRTEPPGRVVDALFRLGHESETDLPPDDRTALVLAGPAADA